MASTEQNRTERFLQRLRWAHLREDGGKGGVFLGQITHYWGGFPTLKAEESLIFGQNTQITCNSFVEKHCLIIFT